MATDDPVTSVNCPKCGERMHYLHSIPSADRAYVDKALTTRMTHIYECHNHGRWRLDLDGMFRPDPPSTH